MSCLHFIVVVQSLSNVQLFATPWTVCNIPGSSVHGISQARILEWLLSPSPGDVPDPWMEFMSPALAGGFFPAKPLGKPLSSLKISQSCL